MLRICAVDCRVVRVVVMFLVKLLSASIITSCAENYVRTAVIRAESVFKMPIDNHNKSKNTTGADHSSAHFGTAQQVWTFPLGLPGWCGAPVIRSGI